MLLLLALLFQDADRLVRELSDDDLEVRTRASATLVEMGPAARAALEKAAAAAGPETKARIADVLKAIARGDRVADLRRHSEPVGKALWIEKAGFAPAGEPDVGAKVAPELFAMAEPQFVLAYWEGDFDRLHTEPFSAILKERPSGAGSVVSRQVFRGRSPGNSYSTGIEDDAWRQAKNGTLDEMIRFWPQWEDNCPILGLQEGLLAGDEDGMRDRLVEASASKRRALRLTALHALRHFRHVESVDAALAALKSDDAKARSVALETVKLLTGCPDDDAAAWWEKNRADSAKVLKRQWAALQRENDWTFHEIPVDAKAADAKARVLKFLEHSDPRAQRDAAMLASELDVADAVPRLRELAEAREAPLRETVLTALADLDRDGSVPILRRRLDDASEDVRRAVVDLLPAAEWESVAKRLADESENVRAAVVRAGHRAKQAADLRKRLPDEKSPELRGMIAVALVLLEADAAAARLLVDESLERRSGIRLDALYALNRMTQAATFDRLASAKYPEIGLNARWQETVEAIEKGAGVKVVAPEAKELRHLRGRGGWSVRLRPAFLRRFVQYLEDPTDAPGWTFVLGDGELKIVEIPEAIEHWKKWRGQ